VEQRSPSPSRSTEARVLLVEDDAPFASVIAQALDARGYAVSIAPDGASALREASIAEPDIVVLDLGLPDIDGLDVCAQLRRWFSNPIVVLSADGAEDRKVAALDLGADDYVTKPFSMPELLARLRVALRHRRMRAAVVDDAVLRVGDLLVDTGARVASAGGAALDLARLELDLLVVLVRNAGKVLTHGALQTSLWGAPDGGKTASLRVHVNQLRSKLGSGPDRPVLVTEPGVGYRLSLPTGT
jgi:two-component system KDP operon response regulator KdpE